MKNLRWCDWDWNLRPRGGEGLKAVWPDWAIYWTLGNFSKPLATISLPKSPTFLGNFWKGVKIFHFSSEIILGKFYRQLDDFFLVTLVEGAYILGLNTIYKWHLTIQQNNQSSLVRWLEAENTNLRGSITMWHTCCLFCLDSAALLMFN